MNDAPFNRKPTEGRPATGSKKAKPSKATAPAAATLPTEDENICYVRGKIVWLGATREVGEDTIKVREFRLALEGENSVKVACWGSKVAALDGLAKDSVVQVVGRLRRDEWEQGEAKNEALSIAIYDSLEDHYVAKDDSEDTVNEVHLSGEVSWAGDLEEIGNKKTAKRLLFVSCRRPLDNGEVSRPSFRVELYGTHAQAGIEVGAEVSVRGMVENRRYRRPDDSFGYAAAVKAFGDGHVVTLRDPEHAPAA